MDFLEGVNILEEIKFIIGGIFIMKKLKKLLGNLKTVEVTMPAKAFTHGGVFHADDVFAGALLRILNPDIEIIRGFKVPDNFDGIVFDIGGGEYDHHQQDAETRLNGVKFASFGLLWRDFGLFLVEENFEAWKSMERLLCQSIDGTDNTGEYNPLSYLIKSMNPSWDSKESADEAYEAAVAVAKTLLENRLDSFNSVNRAKKVVEGAMDKCHGDLLVLPRFAPWQQFVVEKTDYVFVAYPSQRGGYNLQGVPEEEGSLKTVIPFPKKWRGLSGAELVSAVGVPGVTFCHAGGHLLACDSLETVQAVYKLIAYELEPEEFE